MNNLWRTSRPRFQMQQVLDAWVSARELNIVENGGASLSELDEAERVLGRTLPPDLRRLYAAHNGGSFLGGNFLLDPLFPNIVSVTSLTTGSSQFREWQFPVPDELVMFGGSGSESWYGIWLPATGSYRPLIVEVGETSELDSLAIVGDDLASFLAGHSAYYFCLFAEDGFDFGPALDILGVPKRLRSLDEGEDDDEDESAYNALMNWANPVRPVKEPDVYSENAFKPEQVNFIAAVTA